MDKEHAKEEIRILLDRYSQIMKKEREIKSKEEEMTKKDLIRPLFERALGWNFEEDVTAEEKVSKGWVDYGFRINGIPKFFLEAKALREDLDNPSFFRQAVDYAWYKGCTWAVLTNFETVKILNAEWEAPNYLHSRFMTIKCNEFLDRLDDLLLLSRESFEQGLLDKKAEKYGKKTKKTTVDKQLLNDFTRFRDMLSRNIAKLNQEKNLTEEELDESVQRILNRLVFIRNCEDRGLEEKKLWEAKNEARVWKKVKEVFAYYDKNYDSKLFTYDPTDSKKVHLCDTLDIDDRVMREIIDGLYRTKDRSISYDFSIIDADVLGTVYEQYLSHILKKTEKRAKLAENHMHRKEQGIYYTPTYIVDYIVRNTLGELLKSSNVNVEKIRVLDLACGSGSFLIKAFDVLNEYYRKNDREYGQTQLDFETGTTFTRKAKILQNNIFGVDLDKQAVEIAQLNLLLKIAEKGHRLPLLEKNIRCGNSLVDNEKLCGEKAFKWEREFKEIMEEGGFDVIIGNPPYFNIKSDSELRSLEDYKLLSNGVVNVSALFVKRSIDLLKLNGYLGFIIPKSFAYVDSWKPLRDFIYNNAQFVKIVDVSKAFSEVLLEQVIIIIKKQKPILSEAVEITSDFNRLNQKTSYTNYRELISNNIIPFSSGVSEQNLFEKIKHHSVMLSEISENFRGIGAQKCVSEVATSDSERIISGKEIRRYCISDYHNYFIAKEHVSLFKKADKLRQPKIMCQNIVAHIRNHIKITATYDEKGFLNLDTVNNIVIKNPRFLPKYIVALLNSKLISYYAYNFIYSKAIRTMHFDSSYSGKIPIRDIPIENQRVFEQICDRLISLSCKLLDKETKATDETLRIKNEIVEMEKILDNKVYELYGLEKEEIDTIEKTFE